MYIYKDVLKMANEIEENFNTKCFVCGRGVRKLLKRQELKRKHFSLIVEPKENTTFDGLKEVYGEKVVNDNGVIKLSDVTIKIMPLGDYLEKFNTDIQKAYIKSNGDITLKGKGLMDTRKRLIGITDIDEVVKDNNRLTRVLDLRYEGFYLTEKDLDFIKENVSEEGLIKAYKRAIDLKSPNIYRTVVDDLNMIGRFIPSYAKQYRYLDLASFPCDFLHKIDTITRNTLVVYLSDLFYEYGDKITEKTGLTELNFYNPYDVVSYLNLFKLIEEKSRMKIDENEIKNFFNKLGYSNSEVKNMIFNLLNFKEKVCPNRYIRCCSYFEIKEFLIDVDFDIDGNFITALIMHICC